MSVRGVFRLSILAFRGPIISLINGRWSINNRVVLPEGWGDFIIKAVLARLSIVDVEMERIRRRSVVICFLWGNILYPFQCYKRPYYFARVF